jgi:hypothetical protein
MNTADLTQAIATLEDKKQARSKRADLINDQIQLAVQHTRDLGEQQNAIVAEQSAIQNAIDWSQVALIRGWPDRGNQDCRSQG